MRKNLLRAMELLPEALTGDPTAQAVLVTFDFLSNRKRRQSIELRESRRQMIYSVNCIRDREERVGFEIHLRTAIPHKQLSINEWHAMCMQYSIIFPFLCEFIPGDKNLWIFAYDDSPFSNQFFRSVARRCISPQNCFFVVYKSNPSTECVEWLIENAHEKLSKYLTTEELSNQVFVINSDTNNGFDRLIKAIHNRMSEAKILQSPTP